ncbi:anchored repeat ABC transporter substrate-binding protein [Trueperella bonasi]|uniref:Anchored repeat ABC transporter substrate-binding protein n=1 Tax=Trueperella bonasi TaxID=312286 RepID=A0ABT9NFQ6_9ACTO|nr:anchored repeat ABC transporter, substrate-binding protein [Trueperella bonasi]MDP9806229.1 anchored repeat ABC transporter substrate-binding protein [Trueperella bonasi]
MTTSFTGARRATTGAHRLRYTLLAILLALAGCSVASAETSDDDGLVVVASTPIIADLVANVAPNAQIHTLIPMGADPHAYEPSMAALRDITRADVAFSNQLLLELQALTNTIDANLPEGAPHVGLGEEAIKFGGYHIPLVEDVALSTVWLGFRVDGTGGTTETVTIAATEATGPGNISAFTTGTFGEPTPWISSHDGIDEHDAVELPTNAHTHMSWGFTEQGTYTLTLEATHHCDDGDRHLGSATLTFVVGDNPHADGRTVINSGHMDITAHMAGGMTLFGDGPNGGTVNLRPESVVLAVPNTTVTVVPDNKWRFLGSPGDETWILAQAVIGRHVHGEIDPHLWHDVRNGIAYVEVIADELAKIDPENAYEYADNASAYIAKLEVVDDWARSVLQTIEPDKRTLITAHDSFGYMARAYDLDIAGFVAPNPSLEPSIQQIANLTRTLEATPAAGVFLEPTSAVHVAELTTVAQATDKRICNIYSDTLTPEVPTYIAMFDHNIRSLKSCLDRDSLWAWPLEEHASMPYFEQNIPTTRKDS